MIIRKPYAFLIKNFKLIHFLILLVSGDILYHSVGALDFFNEYVKTRQFLESETLINDTIPLIIIILSMLLIILFSSIAILFNKKGKPILFYITSIIYYIVFIVVCFISREIIKTIMFNGIDPRISRIIRDVWFIAIIFQICVVIFSLIRTLGFDVKKFNFGEDLHELEIDEEDNEEFELSARFDSDRIKMKAAMQKEELRAFFFENKLIIMVILILLLVVVPSGFIAKNIVENKRYKMGEVIKLNKFNIKITDAYVTKKDYKGTPLLHGNNSYLIVKFNLNNLDNEERGINLNNLRLEVNDKIYMPKTTYYESFVDIGKGYDNNMLSKESKDYIAVYAISDDDLKHEMIVRYADKLTVKDSQVNAVYYRTIIKPENIDVEKKLVNRAKGQDLIIEYKELKGTKLNISHSNLKDKFTYEVNGKTKYIINSVGLVLSINYTFESKKISFNDFLNKNAVIRYKYNNSIYSQKINNITPSNYNGKEVYFAVSENLKNASEISLVINVRNTEYVYKLK